MLCIEVKYHGPTNHRGSRFSATIGWSPSNCRAIVQYNYELDTSENQLAAAKAALAKFDGEVDMQRDWTVQPCGQHPTTGGDIFRAFVK